MKNASSTTPGHVRACQAVTTGMYAEAVLWSCQINGEQGVAIVLTQYAGENKMAVMALFVAITPSVDVTFDGERGGGDGGNGPKREFQEAQEITRPSYDPARCVETPRRVRPWRGVLDETYFVREPILMASPINNGEIDPDLDKKRRNNAHPRTEQ